MNLLSLKSILIGAVAAAAIVGPVAASATTYNVQLEAVGSSAQFYVYPEAAYQLAKQFSGGTASHYTAKNASFAHDDRGASVNDETGDLWVVWSQNGTTVDVWAYLSVDSAVGVRAFESAPRASLNQACVAGSGSRRRGIGTGEIVYSVSGTTADQVGYIFFSYETVNGKSNLKYVTLDGIDPFTGIYTTGTLPTCHTGSAIKCTITPNASFSTLRNGTYSAWSIYRAISDDANAANVKSFVTKAQNVAGFGTGVPDFVSFSPVCGVPWTSDEKGLDVYREHFSYSVSNIQSVANNTVTSTVTSTPNDGPAQANVSCTTGGIRSLPFRTLGGYITANNTNTEVMGDVGGAIQGPFTANPTVPGPTTTVPR